MGDNHKNYPQQGNSIIAKLSIQGTCQRALFELESESGARLLVHQQFSFL